MATPNTATSADVPEKFRVVINGFGYHYYPWSGGEASGAPDFATFALTPPFAPKQNTSGGGFGDEDQVFPTFSQKDWSLGEDQKNAQNEAEGASRFWRSKNVDVSKPGRVSIAPAMASITFADEPLAACPRGDGVNTIYVATATNLYELDPEGTITDRGAHGVDSDIVEAIASDPGGNCYLANSSDGEIRKWNTSAFSSFSATEPALSFAYLNNSLYGLDAAAGELNRYSTAGVATALFTWRDAAGTAVVLNGHLTPFGGKLLITMTAGYRGLWVFDGVGVSLLAEFVPNFIPTNTTVSSGTVFVGGYLTGYDATNNVGKGTPAVFYYANGQIGKLWEAQGANTFVSESSETPVVAWRDGILFLDNYENRLLYYNAATGGVSTVGTYTGKTKPLLTAGRFALRFTTGSTGAHIWPSAATQAATGSVSSSLIDFDFSEEKHFCAVRADFDSATNGVGATVNLAYRLDDLDTTNRRNIITNGGFEDNTTGWTAFGSTITRATGDLFGGYVLSVDTGNVLAEEGVVSSVDTSAFAATIGDTFTASAYVKGASGAVRLRLQGVDNPVTTETEQFSSASHALTGTWTRLSVTGTIADPDTELVRLVVGTTSQQNIEFFVDGAQLEEASAVTGYEEGGYTFLTTAVETDTEYDISEEARSISIKAFVNLGTSTFGPALKRIYVKAIPLAVPKKRRMYRLTIANDSDYHGVQRNGWGYTLAQQLIAAYEARSPVEVSDILGTYMGVFENLEFIQVRNSTGDFLANVTMREV